MDSPCVKAPFAENNMSIQASPRTAKRRRPKLATKPSRTVSKSFKAIKLTTQREVLFYGDSLTWGMSHSTSARYKKTWPQLIEERLNGLGYRVVESALCSRTTEHNDPEDQSEWMPGSSASDFNGLHHFGPLFSSHTPTILVIALGTNDLKTRIRRESKTAVSRIVPFLARKTPYEEALTIAESCAKIGEKARLMYSGFCHSEHVDLKIMVVTPPQLVFNDESEKMGYDELSEEISLEFPSAFETMCQDHGFINVGTTPPPMVESVDGVHFTEPAQAMLAESVWKDLKHEIEERKPKTRSRLAKKHEVLMQLK